MRRPPARARRFPDAGVDAAISHGGFDERIQLPAASDGPPMAVTFACFDATPKKVSFGGFLKDLLAGILLVMVRLSEALA